MELNSIFKSNPEVLEFFLNSIKIETTSFEIRRTRLNAGLKEPTIIFLM
jgi:hypothetical protein